MILHQDKVSEDQQDKVSEDQRQRMGPMITTDDLPVPPYWNEPDDGS